METFEFSKHFLKRAKERNLPLNLDKIYFSRKLSRTLKKKIKKQCLLNGIKEECVYKICSINNKLLCYICVPIDIAKYKVITGFEIINNNELSQL